MEKAVLMTIKVNAAKAPVRRPRSESHAIEGMARAQAQSRMTELLSL
jgi:hypothetical protein